MKNFKILSLMVLTSVLLTSCMLEQTCDKITLERQKTLIYDNQTEKDLVIELFIESQDSLNKRCEALQMIQFEFYKATEKDCGHYNPEDVRELETSVFGEKIYNLTDTTSATFAFGPNEFLENIEYGQRYIYKQRYSSGMNENRSREWSKLMIDEGFISTFFQKDSTMIDRFADFYTK